MVLIYTLCGEVVKPLFHKIYFTKKIYREIDIFLISGDTSNYDWDSGYTCHQLGSGSICVQLGQPYAIESMKYAYSEQSIFFLKKTFYINKFLNFRLLLWDCDDRSYSYYIEVSNNKSDWEVVWDRSKQGCKSWQHITFPRRPLVLIRIGKH